MQLIRNNSYLVLIIVLCVLFSVLGIRKNDIVYEKVVVAEGDTLWGYSNQYAKQIPIEKWIEETIKLNELSTTTIRIGDELRLPVGKDFNQRKKATQIAGVGE